jgi:hypothetical protein
MRPRSGGSWFQHSQDKKFAKPHLNIKDWHKPIIPTTAGNINRRIAVQSRLGKKQDPISKGWRHGSSDRMPAQQAQSPEFKLPGTTKQTNKQKITNQTKNPRKYIIHHPGRCEMY